MLQPDVGVDDHKDQPTTSQQAAAREEFARSTKKRQQQKMTCQTTEQSKQFDPRGQQRNHYFSVERNVLSRSILFARFSCVCLLSLVVFFCLARKAGTRGEDNFNSRTRERLGSKPDA